ncbi:hypothetical protein [Halorhabdus amylolytica]|uniref:hypothetical protein n=1 Tax=Halorhabdus amylolytica TaxID=2559573 RepID=UPI0010AB0888|nr:hypothetical protein [Halorhabdus amylolytica]
MSTTNADATDSTDAKPTPEPEALVAALTAKEALEGVPRSSFGDQSGNVMNALEALDRVVLRAADDPATLAAAGECLGEDPATDGGKNSHELAETSERDIHQRHADADRDGAVPVTIELTSPMIELIDIVKEDDQTTAEWVMRELEGALAGHENEYYGEVTGQVKAEVPSEIVRWVRLWEQHLALTGERERTARDVEEYLLDFLELEHEWSLDGGEEFEPKDLLPEFDSGDDDGQDRGGGGGSSASNPHTSTGEDRHADTEA